MLNLQTLMLQIGGLATPWTAVPTIFERAANLGLRTGVAGWFHPYCRIFRDYLTACTFEPMGSGGLAMRSNSVASSMPLHKAAALRWTKEWDLVLTRVFLVGASEASVAHPIEVLYIRRAQLGAFRRLRARAIEYVADHQLDFIFLHLPVPHPVGIYDRSTASLSLNDSANYLDNLALADRTLGEIRYSVRNAGLEPRTLVVSSDHPVRDFWKEFPFWSEEVDRLTSARQSLSTPLFLVVPGSTPPLYDGPLRTLTMYDLVSLLLEGRTPDPSDWRDWMAVR